MTIDEIRKLIASDESRTLELKKSTGELKDGMHSACAFLNSEGGWLLFGITPTSLKIIGQQVTDNTQREISQALSLMEPQVDVKVEYVDVPDHPENKVIALFFDGWVWGKDPYTYHGCPYYRIESTTREMPRQMFEERLRAAKPQYYAWERQKADGVSITDLNEERIRGAVRLGVENGRLPSSALTEPFEKVLSKLQLLKDGAPNNAAAMLFGENLTEYPQLRVRLARFRGTNKISFLDNQRVEGNFFRLMDAGMAFLFKWLPLSGEIKGLMREEHLEIPSVALREALVNALCHRQYEKYNLTIGIAIYDDRIEIENPGELPPQLTPETIKEPHISYPYNPIIADVLYKTTFLENWGSGASRIMDACKAQGVGEPIWESRQGFVVVTFPRVCGAEEVPPAKADLEKTTQKTAQEGTQKSTQKSTQKILSLMAENQQITISELCKITGLSAKGVKKNIEKLKEAGLIRRVGPDKGGHWEVIKDK